MRIEGTFNTNTTQIDSYQFEVNGVTSIHLTLLDGAFEHFFVIVKDTQQKIRALLTYKTRIKQYCISSSFETSDNHTISGSIPNGTWTIDVVRTYPIKAGYTLQIDFDLGVTNFSGRNLLQESYHGISDERIGWYRGDFHMHSAYSDGRVSLLEVSEAAQHQRLDFICISDHSILTTKFPHSDLQILSSTEITWDDDGHYNIHGCKEFIDYAYFVSTTTTKDEALDRMFQHYHKQGCLLSINHPFPKGWEMKHSFDIRSFQTLEVINAPHLIDEEVDNERAIHLFDYLWNHGHYLYGIGGSDAHKKNYFDTYPIAIPTTKVYCEGLSKDHIISAVKQGNAYIQIEEDFEINIYRPDNVKEIILPGQSVAGRVEIKARSKQIVHWELMKNGQVYIKEDDVIFHHIIDVKENESYRLQARDIKGNIILFVNPIHHMNIIAKEYNFQKILHAFYASERK